MYAAVVKLTIDTERAPAAAAAFSNDILPRVKAAAGFIGCYWLDPVEGEGLGVVLFETAQQADMVKPPRFSWSAPGVAIRCAACCCGYPVITANSKEPTASPPLSARISTHIG